MMRTPLRMFFTGLLAAAAAYAQLTLNVVDSSGEHAAPGVYGLGSVYVTETATALFRLRNSTADAVSVATLGVAGVGFSLSGPAIPVTLAAGAAVDFTVAFQANDVGGYSAVLRATGVSILLTATVVPRLTFSLDTGSGTVPLASVDFGTLLRGGTVVRRILIRNGTPTPLTVPAIGVQGSGFALTAVPPSGVALGTQQGGEFSITFSPPSAGAYSGTLTIGDRSYPLAGTATDPPLPKPYVSISLAQAASLQQGTLVIRFDAPAQVGGTGTVTLDFQGAADPAIAFASGGRTASFRVNAGDVQASLPFQTGTTSGVLTFTAQLGSLSDKQSVQIVAAPPGITAIQGTRTASSLQVLVTGYDNTRSAGALAFIFYDASGNAIPPGTIGSNAAAAFSSFFAGSGLGGVFQLNAVFPVTGDASKVAACDVSLSNSAGTAKAQRIVF